MKYIILALSTFMASSTIVASEKVTFDMKIEDGTVAEAVKLVNNFCSNEIEPIVVKNPAEKLSLKFEEISCQAAAKIITDFDAGKG